MPQLTPIPNKQYIARLRGQEEGGWRGDKRFIGHVEFFFGVGDKSDCIVRIETDIEALVEDYGKIINVTEVLAFPHSDADQQDIVLRSNNTSEVFALQFARKSVPDLSILEGCANPRDDDEDEDDDEEDPEDDCDLFYTKAQNPPTPELTAYAKAEETAMAPLEVGPEWQPSEKEADAARMFVQMMNGHLNAEQMLRSFAIAVVRDAVLNAGKVRSFGPVPPWIGSKEQVKFVVRAALKATGLEPFARQHGAKHLLIQPKPVVGTSEEVYAWSRAVEPWLTDSATLKIRWPNLPMVTSDSVMSPVPEGMDKVLAACREMDAKLPPDKFHRGGPIPTQMGRDPITGTFKK